MAKSRDEINRQRREKYAAGRAAGVKRDQLRSVKKASQADTSLGETLAGIFTGAARSLQRALDKTAADLLKDGNIGKAPGKGAARSGGGGTGGKGSSGGGGGKRSGGGGRKGGGGKVPDFEKFAKKHIGKPANEIIREYRKRGGKIGNERGKQMIRDVGGKAKQTQKRTRFKYYGNEKNPQKKAYIKDRYMYVVKYGAQRDGFVEPSVEYATIASSRKLSLSEIKDSLYQMVDEMQMQGKERYKLIEVADGTVEVLYAIDSEL